MRPTLARLAVLVALAAPALGQPMFDPSMLAKMSGVPRPDPQVPAATLTVRVCRGDFSHPMIGQEVTLLGPGGPRTVKTDQASRATFEGLTVGRGTYKARARAGLEVMLSQEIEMPASPGVRLMLVFPADEKAQLGAPDGVARADQRLPTGTVEVRVVDGDDRPLANLAVALAHATKEDNPVEERKALTDGDGRARWSGLRVSEVDGYLVTATRDGLQARGQPFRLQGDHGSLIGLRALTATRNAAAISLSKSSHLILEVKDDDVEVVENLVVENGSASPFDPGPGGLTLPLPTNAVGAQLGPNAPPELTVEGTTATWKGPLPAGETAISFAFLVPQKKGTMAMRQVVPLALDQVALIADRYEGMTIEGPGLQMEERDLNGRKFWVARGPALRPGGAIEVKLAGLPARPTSGRDLAVAASLAILAWGVAAGWRRRGSGPSRLKLEQRRAQLLDQLAPLPADGKGREELTAKLEKVYRELDE